MVCDKCNNYFSRAVEGPVLNSTHFRNLRGRQVVPNKKGEAPPVDALMLGEPVKLYWDKNQACVDLGPKAIQKLMDLSASDKQGTILMPLSGSFDEKLFSRFLAKIGLELFASKIMHVSGWESEIIDLPGLDLIRQYARVGNRPPSWPFHSRRIYDEDAFVISEGGEREQVVHEEDIFSPSIEDKGDHILMEPHVVVCFFGVEYVLNLAEPSTDSYEGYLLKNNGISPLYEDSEMPKNLD